MIIAFWIIFILAYSVFETVKELQEEKQLKKENQKKLDELKQKYND